MQTARDAFVPKHSGKTEIIKKNRIL